MRRLFFFKKIIQPRWKLKRRISGEVVTHACTADVSTLEWRQGMRYTQILLSSSSTRGGYLPSREASG